jgi:uncharacterized membrane protein YfcA
MNFSSLLTEPYSISLICALILTFIAYLFIRESINNDKKNNKNNKNNKDMAKKLLITFVVSFISFMGIIYGAKYLMKSSPRAIMSGGAPTITSVRPVVLESLEIMGNDVDFDLFDS